MRQDAPKSFIYVKYMSVGKYLFMADVVYLESEVIAMCCLWVVPCGGSQEMEVKELLVIIKCLMNQTSM